MKKAELFKRYFWLIDVIHQSGGLSRDEINRRWRYSTLNENSEPAIPERTFHRHKEAIKELFDISIVCDRTDERVYRIDHSDIETSRNVRSWILNTFSLSNILLESHDIEDRILVEDIPSGVPFLSTIITSMRDNRTLYISYQNFFNDKSHSFYIEPYCLKLFRQRWYLLARSSYDDKLRIYGVDRILNLSVSENRFQLSKDFNASSIFEKCFGIIIGTNDKPTTIKFKVINDQQKYIRSLPLHPSQQEICCESDYSIFSIFVKPTFDLIQEFLKYGYNLEVLSPTELRQELSDIAKGMNAIYNELHS
ncbi:MAG: WYL domain-containing protein [Muribaculaceae bacterium]|nr:WYL domain-containing protein [Muribaculaceae bacterium]